MIAKLICFPLLLLTCAATAFATSALAQTDMQADQAIETANTASDFTVFAPQDWTDKRQFDYGVWDRILSKIVIDFGPSARIRASNPAFKSLYGASGHVSAYRLEGSRIGFDYFGEPFRAVLSSYRADLERLGNDVDITRLSRDEQLAYWFNLHNVTLIEQIALQYPLTTPSEIEIDGVFLHEAKLLNLRGHVLSLRDIRERIVFTHWEDPIVIYGFFRGDIGGPRMSRLALDADNLEYILGGNAHEFANALRGVNLARKSRRVSQLYRDVAPYFFPKGAPDIEAHLRRFAEGGALDALDRRALPLTFDRYNTRIADISGGSTGMSQAEMLNRTTGDGLVGLSPDALRLLKEAESKRKMLKRRGKYTGKQTGRITIVDIETDAKQPPTPGSTIR